MADPDAVEVRAIPVPDGRSLEVRLAGPPTGGVVLWHHGSPGGGLPPAGLVEALAARDLRFVGLTRPGYAGSTRLPGRSIAAIAADARTVLDALGIERGYVLGESGGGPHVMACAALIPERVIAAAALASVAPYDAPGLDWAAGMGPENVEEFGAAAAGPPELQPFLEAQLAGFGEVTGEQVAEALGGLIDEVDRAALTGWYAESVAADFRLSLSSGIWGWLDDDLAFVRPWGFGLDAITVPLDLWQGDHDRMVPYAHGGWLAANVHGPSVRVHLLAGHGHLSLAAALLDEILDTLTGAGARSR
jgi:pimeloyl-ACP methyl ester carboxylesterase